MSGSARICLGIGYRADNAEVALASALVLVGLGEEAYGELLGHHLMNGFATPKRPDRGIEWLDDAGQALEAGASPLVANGSQAHAALLQQAVAELTGRPADAAGRRRTSGKSVLRFADGPRSLELRLGSAELRALPGHGAFARSRASAVVAELVDAQR